MNIGYILLALSALFSGIYTVSNYSTTNKNLNDLMKYKQFLEKTLEKSKLFSQDSFTKTYTEALDVVIGEIKQ